MKLNDTIKTILTSRVIAATIIGLISLQIFNQSIKRYDTALDTAEKITTDVLDSGQEAFGGLLSEFERIASQIDLTEMDTLTAEQFARRVEIMKLTNEGLSEVSTSLQNAAEISENITEFFQTPEGRQLLLEMIYQGNQTQMPPGLNHGEGHGHYFDPSVIVPPSDSLNFEI